MPRIADYSIIADGFVTLPKSNGDIDHDYDSFDAPGVHTGSRSVLAFVINPDPDDTVTVTVTINGTKVLGRDFDTEPVRSFHEVVQAGVLKASGNVLSITRTGSGKISVSDIVLFWQRDI